MVICVTYYSKLIKYTIDYYTFRCIKLEHKDINNITQPRGVGSFIENGKAMFQVSCWP
jgi:hypothetical protein